MKMVLAVNNGLDKVGEWLPQLGLRALLAWEFFESGVTKWRGENWFGYIQDQFLFPFNLVPPDISWALATWIEIVGALLLLVGLATRFVSASLIVLTIVAIGAVHWPNEWASIGELLQGYAITDQGHGNYKLPLIFIVMLLPLVFSGAGRASVDWWLLRRNYGHKA